MAIARWRTFCAGFAACTSPTIGTSVSSACAYSPSRDYNSRILLLVNGHRVKDNVASLSRSINTTTKFRAVVVADLAQPDLVAFAIGRRHRARDHTPSQCRVVFSR